MKRKKSEGSPSPVLSISQEGRAINKATRPKAGHWFAPTGYSCANHEGGCYMKEVPIGSSLVGIVLSLSFLSFVVQRQSWVAFGRILLGFFFLSVLLALSFQRTCVYCHLV